MLNVVNSDFHLSVNFVFTQYAFFFLFSFLAITTSLIAIAAKNPIHSVFFLILVFFNSAGLLILLSSEFLAMLFLIVYVGAIAVLFLFVVMMLNINYISLRKYAKESQNLVLPAGILIIFLFLVELFSLTEQGVLINIFSLTGPNSIIDIQYYLHLVQSFFEKNYNGFVIYTNAHQFGIIYNGYIYYFLISSVILLVAMIGAIMLTLHRRIGVRKQNIYTQISRDFEKAIKVL